jgi:transmembrane sensor
VASIEEEAAAWVTLLAGRAPGADERVRFDDWIGRSPMHAAAYENALRTWRDLAAMRDSEQYRALLGETTFREKMVRELSAPRWAAAALGAAAIAAAAWVGSSLDLPSLLRQPTQITTQLAEVRETTLPDGSQVVLGAESQLSYKVTGGMRHATLAGGDAYFAVSRDPQRPFEVSIDDVRVRVVGTQFEIRRRDGEISVAVAEGTVEVLRPYGAASVRLQRGEALTARDGRASTIHIIAPADIAAWRSGRLVYDNAELREVIADANRYARSRIVIEDAQLEELRVTTSFRTSQIEGMIETLQATLPLVAERGADGGIVLRARL